MKVNIQIPSLMSFKVELRKFCSHKFLIMTNYINKSIFNPLKHKYYDFQDSLGLDLNINWFRLIWLIKYCCILQTLNAAALNSCRCSNGSYICMKKSCWVIVPDYFKVASDLKKKYFNAIFVDLGNM